MNEAPTELIREYRLLQFLGQGAQARIYKAECTSDTNPCVKKHRLVALKKLNFNSGEESGERFRRRFALLQGLQHPNILDYIETFDWPPDSFLRETYCVMEFLDGETLDARIKAHPHGLPLAEVQAIFRQCLAGLIHARSRHITHRDIKPSNIIILRSGVVKLIDFEIARDDTEIDASSVGWKGTFDYMAPDFVTEPSFRGDERSDIFSVGVCIYMALTGELPWPALGDNAHLGHLQRWKSDRSTVPSAQLGPLRVIQGIESFIHGCLAPSRDKRLHRFEDVAQRLSRLQFYGLSGAGGDKYELRGYLGKGGCGLVFHGVRVKDNLRVAVKQPLSLEHADRFIREANLLFNVSKEPSFSNIVRYVDFIVEVESDGQRRISLVMEYLKGMPSWGLHRRIRASPSGLELAEVDVLFHGYLRGLQFLHDHNIIHRDIKPANLYAPQDDPKQARIFDLGIARDIAGAQTRGLVPGTLEYMPPEFTEGATHRGTAQSDIFSLGLCLYEALTGKPAFPRLPTDETGGWLALVERYRGDAIPSFEAGVFDTHPNLRKVLSKALHKLPGRRYASARAMSTDLRAAIRGARMPAEVSTLDPATVATVQDGSAAVVAPPPDGFRADGQSAEQPETPPLHEMAVKSPRVRPPQPRPPPRERKVEPQPVPPAKSPPPRRASPPWHINWAKLSAWAAGFVIILASLGALAYWAMHKDEHYIAGVLRRLAAQSAVSEPAYVDELNRSMMLCKQKIDSEAHNADLWQESLQTLRALVDIKVKADFDREFDRVLKLEDTEAARALIGRWIGISDQTHVFEALGNTHAARIEQMNTRLAIVIAIVRGKEDEKRYKAEVDRIGGAITTSLAGADAEALEAAIDSIRRMEGSVPSSIAPTRISQSMAELNRAADQGLKTLIATLSDNARGKYMAGRIEEGDAERKKLEGLGGPVKSVAGTGPELQQQWTTSIAELASMHARVIFESDCAKETDSMAGLETPDQAVKVLDACDKLDRNAQAKAQPERIAAIRTQLGERVTRWVQLHGAKGLTAFGTGQDLTEGDKAIRDVEEIQRKIGSRLALPVVDKTLKELRNVRTDYEKAIAIKLDHIGNMEKQLSSGTFEARRNAVVGLVALSALPSADPRVHNALQGTVVGCTNALRQSMNVSDVTTRLGHLAAIRDLLGDPRLRALCGDGLVNDLTAALAGEQRVFVLVVSNATPWAIERRGIATNTPVIGPQEVKRFLFTSTGAVTRSIAFHGPDAYYPHLETVSILPGGGAVVRVATLTPKPRRVSLRVPTVSADTPPVTIRCRSASTNVPARLSGSAQQQQYDWNLAPSSYDFDVLRPDYEGSIITVDIPPGTNSVDLSEQVQLPSKARAPVETLQKMEQELANASPAEASGPKLAEIVALSGKTTLLDFEWPQHRLRFERTLYTARNGLTKAAHKAWTEGADSMRSGQFVDAAVKFQAAAQVFDPHGGPAPMPCRYYASLFNSSLCEFMKDTGTVTVAKACIQRGDELLRQKDVPVAGNLVDRFRSYAKLTGSMQKLEYRMIRGDIMKLAPMLPADCD